MGHGPQSGRWCHPRDAPDPPSCQDATAQGKRCAGPCFPEQPTQASPWLIKRSPTRNRVSRQFFILTKFKELNSIACACPLSPPPSSHRTHSCILLTSQDTALYKYISFNIPSWEELTLSFKSIKCSYLFHFFFPRTKQTLDTGHVFCHQITSLYLKQNLRYIHRLYQWMLYARYIINMFGEVFINNLLYNWV